ncbi:YEATS domain-containing protein 2 isoform X2 [Lingula anatina]|uniref:YEATS domain-containing protein 2 n=1 Tax=Lingula anatina TaxID=7574 RepID=A0A1S3JI56_LINAN|nr:YEATS domain-containing protein 2 isoform X2 [Lingula anatina]|eukprot:XP_013410048.1 YEATS domain-containing protein 2 isoform X2 [Lingula anatina]
MAATMSSNLKRTLVDQDPDYDEIVDSQSKRRRVIEKDAKDATVHRIEAIIQSQFSQEFKNKEAEAEEIDRRLQQTRTMLDRLRACIVASYYSNAGSSQSKSEPAMPSIHPTVKKHLGKTVKNTEVIGQSELGPGQGSHAQERGQVGLKEQSSGSSVSGKSERRETQCSQAAPAVSPSRGGRFKIKKRIVVGNVSKYIPFEKRDENDHATHKWMVYVRGSKEEPHIDGFVKKVRFFLHPSYRPNDLVEVSQPPFHLTRRGWGEFPIRVQLHFRDQRNKSVDIIHQLKLDRTYTGLQTLGAETVVDVDLEKAESIVPVAKTAAATLTTSASPVAESVTNHTEYQMKRTEESHSKLKSSSDTAKVKTAGDKFNQVVTPVKKNGLVQNAMSSTESNTPTKNFSDPVCQLQMKKIDNSHSGHQEKLGVGTAPRDNSKSPVGKTKCDSLKTDNLGGSNSPGLKAAAALPLMGSAPIDTKAKTTLASVVTQENLPVINSNTDQILMTKLPPGKQTPVKVKLPAADSKVSAAGSSNVYVRCVDAQGKVYLIPQHLLVKSTPGGATVPHGAAIPQGKVLQLNSGSDVLLGGRLSPKGQGQMLSLGQGQGSQPIVFLQNSALVQGNSSPVLQQSPTKLGRSVSGQNTGVVKTASSGAVNSATSLLGKSFTISGTRIGGLNNSSNQAVTAAVTSLLRSPQKVGQGQQAQVGIQVQGQIINSGQGQVSILKPGSVLKGIVKGTPSPSFSPGRAVLIQGGTPQTQRSGSTTPGASPQRPTSAQGVYIKSEPGSPRGGTPVNLVSLPGSSRSSPARSHPGTPVHLLGRAGTPVNTPGSIIPGHGSPTGGISVTIKQEPGALSAAQLGISALTGSKPPQTEPVQFVDPGVAPQNLAGGQKVHHLVLSQGIKQESAVGQVFSNSAQLTVVQNASSSDSEPRASDLGIPTQKVTLGTSVSGNSGGQVGQWTVVKSSVGRKENPAASALSQPAQNSMSKDINVAVTSPTVTVTASSPAVSSASTSTVSQNIVTMIGGQPFLVFNQQGGATSTSGTSAPLMLVPAVLGKNVQQFNVATGNSKQPSAKLTHGATYVVGSANEKHLSESKSIMSKKNSLVAEDSRPTENVDIERVISLSDMEDMECLVKTLVKQHPLVATYTASGEENDSPPIHRHLHPYCAKTKEDFFKWNIGKRRAAEWQRACWVRRKMKTLLVWKEEFKGEKLWSTKQIMLWCRYHCYTPILQESRQLVFPSLYHSGQKFSSYTGSKDMMEKIDTLIAKRGTQEEEDVVIDVLQDVYTCSNKSDVKEESPVKKDPLLHTLPISPAAEFVHETAREIGICYQPVEVWRDTQANVLEDMILSAVKCLADDIIRGAFSLASQSRGFPEELTPIDIYRSIEAQKKCDFLTNKHLGIDRNEALGLSNMSDSVSR